MGGARGRSIRSCGGRSRGPTLSRADMATPCRQIGRDRGHSDNRTRATIRWRPGRRPSPERGEVPRPRHSPRSPGTPPIVPSTSLPTRTAPTSLPPSWPTGHAFASAWTSSTLSLARTASRPWSEPSPEPARDRDALEALAWMESGMPDSKVGYGPDAPQLTPEQPAAPGSEWSKYGTSGSVNEPAPPPDRAENPSPRSSGTRTARACPASGAVR